MLGLKNLTTIIKDIQKKVDFLYQELASPPASAKTEERPTEGRERISVAAAKEMLQIKHNIGITWFVARGIDVDRHPDIRGGLVYKDSLEEYMKREAEKNSDRRNRVSVPPGRMTIGGVALKYEFEQLGVNGTDLYNLCKLYNIPVYPYGRTKQKYRAMIDKCNIHKLYDLAVKYKKK